MTVHRFFVAPDEAHGDHFALPAAIERQVRTVLRLRDGARIVLLTGDGNEAVCRLDAGMCVLEERRASVGEPRHRLTIVQALLKGDALDEVVQHGTEVGVAEFRLVVTERCVARELSVRRLERLQAIARESAEQSERGIVPVVRGPVALGGALSSGSVLLLERYPVALRELEAPPASLIIGPEGGFTPNEVSAATNSGVQLAGLGPRILRSQTVAVAASAVILSRAGDFA